MYAFLILRLEPRRNFFCFNSGPRHQQSILHYAVQAARNEVVAYLLETHSTPFYSLASSAFHVSTGSLPAIMVADTRAEFPKEDIAVCLEIAIAMADVQMQNMLQSTAATFTAPRTAPTTIQMHWVLPAPRRSYQHPRAFYARFGSASYYY